MFFWAGVVAGEVLIVAWELFDCGHGCEAIVEEEDEGHRF